jgi:transposase InsO family protein
VEATRRGLHDSPFHGEGHRKVWARLRIAGIRTSKRRVLRLMREGGLLAPLRAGSPCGPRGDDGTIIPDAVDIMCGTDLTTTVTGQGQAALFVAVDHHATECVGIHAALRHDHGSQYMAEDLHEELRFLRIESSPALVRAPEGNGCAERFIRTLKKSLFWVRTFETVEGRGHCPRPPAAARVSPGLQRHLAHRATRPQTTRRRPPATASNRGR